MDVKENNGISRRRIEKFNKKKSTLYDWESEGVLNKCLPKILFKGNALLVTFLQLIDMRIILMIKYVKRLQQFKDFMK